MEQQSYPVDASKWGSNAYYLDNCDVIGHRPNYAVCLYKLEVFSDEKINDTWGFRKSREDCQRACDRGNCKAQSMREEELTAGKAIYFVPRDVIRTESVERDRIAGQRVSAIAAASDRSSTKKPHSTVSAARHPAPVQHNAPTAPVKHTEPVKPSYAVELDMSAAITAAVAEHTTPVEPAHATTAKMLPGESPLEFAKRIRALRQLGA